MKQYIFLIIVFSLTVLFACDEPNQPIDNPDNTTDEDSTNTEADTLGTVAFFTNAQELLFCDTINVDIYINDTWQGTIKQSCIIDSISEENSSDSIIITQLAPGSYTYYAISNCGDSIFWNGEFTIKEDSTELIHLNVWDVADDITQTHMKLIGTWEDYMSNANPLSVIFTKRDSVIEDYTRGTYNVIYKDSIEVIRPELDKIYSKHKIIFSGNDTLRLRQFTRVGYGITGYADLFLKRIN